MKQRLRIWLAGENSNSTLWFIPQSLQARLLLILGACLLIVLSQWPGLDMIENFIHAKHDFSLSVPNQLTRVIYKNSGGEGIISTNSNELRNFREGKTISGNSIGQPENQYSRITGKMRADISINNFKYAFLYLIFIVVFPVIIVRQAMKRLAALVAVAESLSPAELGPVLDERGPTEVRAVARALNGMCNRISEHLNERIQVLSAFSHDMQTPITRMRLRAEMADDFPDRRKFLRDLDETEQLVREGIAYARGVHVNEEAVANIQVFSFIQMVALDYQDTGQPVFVSECEEGILRTKPRALRRIMTNLIDNALKYSGEAEIAAIWIGNGRLLVSVMDRGPGIDEDKLQVVKRPFVKLQRSSFRKTSGAGLGLAIAEQLAESISGLIELRNRDGGGLIAEISLAHLQHDSQAA